MQISFRHDPTFWSNQPPLRYATQNHSAGMMHLLFHHDHLCWLSFEEKPTIELPFKHTSLTDDLTSYPIILFGTPFQCQVWETLTTVPKGETRTYQDIANSLKLPNHTRAVANAIGKNPISLLIPCHRVIRSDGSLGGYRWGIKIKQILLREERTNYEQSHLDEAAHRHM